MSTELTAHRVGAPAAEHGEGPLWTRDDGMLRWVDMLRGDVLSWNPATRESTRDHLDTLVAAIRPRVDGGFVIALERGFGLWVDGAVTVFPEIWSDPTIRMNDGSCDTEGRFYCGSMADDAAPGRGAVHRLDADGTVVTVLDSVTISNGLAFSADGSYAIYVDSAAGGLHRVDLSRGDAAWAQREVFVTIDPADGIPDGICMDSEGGIWVALWAGAAVHRYSATGELTHRVSVAASHPTACVLGGPDLTDLYITTSTLESTPATDPDGGALFTVIVDVAGLPALPFR